MRGQIVGWPLFCTCRTFALLAPPLWVGVVNCTCRTFALLAFTFLVQLFTTFFVGCRKLYMSNFCAPGSTFCGWLLFLYMSNFLRSWLSGVILTPHYCGFPTGMRGQEKGFSPFQAQIILYSPIIGFYFQPLLSNSFISITYIGYTYVL